jgi:6,7-dimethyl-8-ribityllumazine synthase
MEEITSVGGGHGLRIGIGLARFNEEVGAAELVSCHETLRAAGVADADIAVVRVAGALELPLVLQQLAQTGRFDALVALGAVIRGETYHFEIVSDQAAAGLMQVQLDTGIPVANGVLTTNDDAQAMARAVDKGRDCALVAIEMARLRERLVERYK